MNNSIRLFSSCLGWGMALVLCLAAIAGAAPVRVDGLWKIGPETWRIQTIGDVVAANYVDHDRDNYTLFKPGEKMLELRQTGFRFEGKVHARFKGRAGRVCPQHQDRWEEIELEMSSDGNTLSGTWKSRKLNLLDCTLSQAHVPKTVVLQRLANEAVLSIRSRRPGGEVFLGERFQVQLLHTEPFPAPRSVQLTSAGRIQDIYLFPFSIDDGQSTHPYILRSRALMADEFEVDEKPEDVVLVTPGESMVARTGDLTAEAPVSAVVIDDVEILGFHDNADAPLACTPALPRFFFNEEGLPCIDLSWPEVAQASAIGIRLKYRDAEKFPVSVDRSTLEAAPGSNERWTTLNLFERYSEAWAYSYPELYAYLMDEFTTFYFEVTLVDAGGGETTYSSPPITKYELLHWMRVRLDAIASQLWSTTFIQAPKEERARETLAWRTFLRRSTIDAKVTLRNIGQSAIVSSGATVDPLMAPGWRPPLSPSAGLPLARSPSESIILQPGEPHEQFVRVFSPRSWPEDKVVALQGIQTIVGPHRKEKVAARFLSRSSVIKGFTVDPFDPRRTASLLIYDNMRGTSGTDDDLVLSANRLIDEQTAPGDTELWWKPAQEAARDWRGRLQEYPELIKVREAAFNATGYGELHDLITSGFPNRRVSIGLPTDHLDLIMDPNARPEGMTNRGVFDLDLPNTIVFTGTMIAIGTGGRSAGGVAPSEEFARLQELQRTRKEVRVAQADMQWLPPSGYIDDFLRLSRDELEEIVDSLDMRKPFSAIKGAIGEALASRQHGKAAAEELTRSGRPGHYVAGTRIRHYKGNDDGQITGGRGSLMTDGLVVTIQGGKVVPHHILEVKAGASGMTRARDQLSFHYQRINDDGLAIREPTDADLRFLGEYGKLQTRRIGGKLRKVLYIPRKNIDLPPPSDTLLIPVGPAQIGCLDPHGRRLSLRQSQLEDLTQDLMILAGRDPGLWDNLHFSLKGYQEFYRQLDMADSARLSDDEVRTRFINGERFNPKSGKWELIFTGKHTLANPYMGIREFEKAYADERRSRGLQVTDQDRSKARQKFREGFRWQPSPGQGRPGRWYKPDFLFHPGEPTLTTFEREVLYERMTGSRLTEEQKEKVRRGEYYDWRAGLNGWKKGNDIPDDAIRAPSPRNSPFRRLRTTDKLDLATELLDLVAIGVFEYHRLASQSIRVGVYAVSDSPVVYLQVRRKIIEPDGTSWDLAGSPALQKMLLIQFYMQSRSFTGRGGAPEWLTEASLTKYPGDE